MSNRAPEGSGLIVGVPARVALRGRCWLPPAPSPLSPSPLRPYPDRGAAPGQSLQPKSVPRSSNPTAMGPPKFQKKSSKKQLNTLVKYKMK